MIKCVCYFIVFSVRHSDYCSQRLGMRVRDASRGLPAVHPHRPKGLLLPREEASASCAKKQAREQTIKGRSCLSPAGKRTRSLSTSRSAVPLSFPALKRKSREHMLTASLDFVCSLYNPIPLLLCSCFSFLINATTCSQRPIFIKAPS